MNERDDSRLVARMLTAADVGSTKALLDAGATVDMMDPGGRAALWYAARAGHPEAVQLLAQHHAEVDRPRVQ